MNLAPLRTFQKACPSRSIGLLTLVLTLSAGAQSPRSSPGAEDGYRIAGKVVNAESGVPLSGAQVAIVAVVGGLRPPLDEDAPPHRGRRGPRGPTATAVQSVTTSEDGVFTFEHLPAGKYSLEGSRRGFITASYQEHGFYSTAIVTGTSASSEHLTLKLSAGAVIGGSVLDAGGDPLEQASVSLYRLSDDGLGNIRIFRRAAADDLGAYEFSHLPPGNYFVSANASVWYATAAIQGPPTLSPGDRAIPGPQPASPSQLDLVYPRVFYPDATDSNAAVPIPIRGGEHLRTDLHMQAVPAVHLTYKMPSTRTTGGGLHTFAQPPIPFQSVFGGRDPAENSLAVRQDPNQQTYSLSVAPGEYEVEVAGRSLPINATGDTALDASGGSIPVEVVGKVAAAGGTALPGSIDVSLLAAESHGASGTSAFSTVAHDGAFRFEQVRPGAYEVVAQAEGRPMAIVQLAANGAQLEGHVLHIGTQSVTFAATLAPASALVSGFASTSAREHVEPKGVDEMASGAMIVLVPQHLTDHALYRRDQSDSDGSFTLRQIAAGRYTLVAIHDGWDLEWARPEVIAHYLPGGQSVLITPLSTGVTQLARPLVVQPR